MMTTCCHVPRRSWLSAKGIVSDGLRRAARTWLEQRSAMGAGAIIVAPGIVVVVGRALGNDFLKEFRQVLHQSGLKLHGGYAGGGTGDEDCRLPFLQFAL